VLNEIAVAKVVCSSRKFEIVPALHCHSSYCCEACDRGGKRQCNTWLDA